MAGTNTPLFNTGSSFFDGILNGGTQLAGNLFGMAAKNKELNVRQREAEAREAEARSRAKARLRPVAAKKTVQDQVSGFFSGMTSAQKITISMGAAGLLIAFLGLKRR